MTNDSPNRAVMVVLAYLWPLAIVPLVTAKDDLDIQWHARHGLVLLAAEFAWFVVLWLSIGLVSLVSPGVGCAMGIIVVASGIAMLVVHCVAVVKALAGGRLLLPWVSDYAARF